MKFAIVRSTYRPEIVDHLFEGASAVLSEAGAVYESVEVAGALEIPAAVAFLQAGKKKYDGYVVLGCILKGETIHDEVIAYTAFQALDQIAREQCVPVGNGILTVNTMAQAVERADPQQQNRGGEAARAVLRMLALRKSVGC